MVREGWLQGKAGPSVQEAFAYADARIKERYSDRRPVQFDRSGQQLRFGSAPTYSPSSSESPPTTSPPSSPTTEPPEQSSCSFVVLCRRS
jgi:hypothetical protein